MKDTAMLKNPRPGAAAGIAQLARVVPCVVLGSSLLLGCARPPAAPPAPSKQAFSVNMPLDVLAAAPAANAILYRDIPGVMTNPKYPLFSDMSLAQIAIVSAGKLPKETLDKVQADFDKLAAQ